VQTKLIVGAVVVVGLYWLLERSSSAASSSSLQCASGETVGTFNGLPACLHQGGVGFAGGDGSDTSSPVSNESVGDTFANVWDRVLGLLDSAIGNGPVTSPDQTDQSVNLSTGPVTSPDQT